jgi:hypothetical protein
MGRHYRQNAARVAAVVAAILPALAAFLLDGAGRPAYAQAGPFPSAIVKVWDTAAPVGGIPLGATPGESIEDPAGLTRHGTGAPTVVTVYARSSHPRGPSGVSYWSPDTNTFAWYGKTVGFPGGADINRTGPAQSMPSAVFGSVTFGPGDVWVGGLQFQPLYVHFAGTNRFRTYGTPSPVTASDARAFGVKVDQRTGDVFVVLPGPQASEGVLVRVSPLAPAPPGTVVVTDWIVGGVGAGPAGITLDSAGRPIITLSGLDIVARVDPGTDGVLGSPDDIATFWRVPNRGNIRSFRTVPAAVPVLGEENPNAVVTTDAGGDIWFAQSNSNEIGRLSTGPDGILGSPDDVICEYTKSGLANPQQIATTGSGSLLQVYFTEGEGNSVSVLTQAEADLAGAPTRVCATVPAETAALSPFTALAPFFDEEIEPLQTTIVPTVHVVQGRDGTASGTTTTADGALIPPILRFSPMPNPLLSVNGIPTGDAGNGFPSGLTGVYANNRIAGAYLRGNKHFELQSAAVIAPPRPQASKGGDTVCVGLLTGARDNVVVPAGATCSIVSATVKGNVKVYGFLDVFAPTTIRGNIEGEPGHGFVRLHGGAIVVRGNVKVKDSPSGLAAGYLAGTSIRGNFEYEGNTGALFATGGTITGNVKVDKNTGGGSISDNFITGNLECKDNGPQIGGSGNVVDGNIKCPE